ncbi:MAG: hypothetical protein KTR32_37240 [Granulosicoccus sp.]|nr:hypothetical protein [Granulosicoccus sp.]
MYLQSRFNSLRSERPVNQAESLEPHSTGRQTLLVREISPAASASRSADTTLKSNAQRSRTLIIACLALWLVLIFPGHPQAFEIATFLQFPIELPLIVLLLICTPASISNSLCRLLAGLLCALLLLRMADIGSYLAFNRRFDPLLEMHLLSDGWNLASTSVGPSQALIIVFAALCTLAAFGWGLYRCLFHISMARAQRSSLITFALLSVLTAILALIADRVIDQKGIFRAEIAPEFELRATRLSKSIRDQQEFITQLQFDSVLDEQTPGFSALQGKDVIIMFIESYGRSYLDAERFRPASHSLLSRMEKTINEADVQIRSGWLESPIRGGRSWLAHASLHAGLKIDSQARYDRLITSERKTIADLFEGAGWQSIGIMPAIQFEWPESHWYSYDKLFVNDDLDFQGERFGYVTMPDQYTLSHFENNIRAKSDDAIMATMALLSTHAPWTPLPRKLPWEDIGDGSVYDGSHRFGERISWKYRSQVQDMYIQSFEYTMDILADYIARYAGNSLIIILGDHQPAPIINGWGDSADVPIHILAKDRSLLDRLPAELWATGMIPNATSTSQPMWQFRKFLATAFE